MSIFEENDDAVQKSQESSAPPEETKEEVTSTVPLEALNESRAQLRQTQTELNSLREQMQQFERLRGELDEYRQRQTQSTEEQEFNADPLGSMQKQLKALQDQINQRNQKQDESYRQAQQAQQLHNLVASQVSEFRKSHTDYDDALSFVMDARRKELEILGVSENQIQAELGNHAEELARTALQSNRNPAQLVYDLAKLRGFEAKKVGEKLQAVQKGQESASSLSGASGKEDSGLSLGDIANMSDDDFDRLWSDMEKQERRTAH